MTELKPSTKNLEINIIDTEFKSQMYDNGTTTVPKELRQLLGMNEEVLKDYDIAFVFDGKQIVVRFYDKNGG